MNKKGFTLVELLVVIAILGALLILALPRITETLNKSRKDVFYNEVLEIYKTALSQKQVDNDGKHRPISYCREKGEECDGDYHILELSGTTKVDFIISITSFDKVTHFEARDDRFKFYYDGEGLEFENIYVTDIYFADEEIPIDEACTLKGDVNGDGNITKEDSDLVLDYNVGESEFNDNQKLIGDVNCDGSVDSVDAMLILQIAEGEKTYAEIRDAHKDACTPRETTMSFCNTK